VHRSVVALDFAQHVVQAALRPEAPGDLGPSRVSYVQLWSTVYRDMSLRLPLACPWGRGIKVEQGFGSVVPFALQSAW